MLNCSCCWIINLHGDLTYCAPYCFLIDELTMLVKPKTNTLDSNWASNMIASLMVENVKDYPRTIAQRAGIVM